MLLIPAIDLKQGHCVRLEQGDMDKVTTFSEDPGAMARHWVEQGARRLHLVDLDGAFAGKPKNEAAIKSILKAVGDDIPVQLGGGIRDLETIERLLDDGLSYVVIGTAAVKNPGFLQDACADAFFKFALMARSTFTPRIWLKSSCNSTRPIKLILGGLSSSIKRSRSLSGSCSCRT